MFKAAIFACATTAANIIIEDFSKPIHEWKANNDPVMGGKSFSTTTITDGMLVFNGSVVDVPSLQAPGFVTSIANDKQPWPDVSGCKDLSMTLRSLTDYAGYRISFGRAKAIVCGKFFAYGYKSPFKAPSDFDTISLPFSDFSDCWDDSTGNIITPCSDNSHFCPTQKALQNLETMSIWGEGVGGDVHLEVKSITATNCA